MLIKCLIFRYRSLDSLKAELTSILSRTVTLPCGVRTIYSMEGKKISTIEELEDGKEYVCAGKGESFKRIEYNKIVDAKRFKRLTNCKLPSHPKIVAPECVRPRIVTIIRNGIKPRKVRISLLFVLR